MLEDFRRLKIAQEGSRKLKKVKECHMRKDSKKFKIYKVLEGSRRFQKVSEGSRKSRRFKEFQEGSHKG